MLRTDSCAVRISLPLSYSRIKVSKPNKESIPMGMNKDLNQAENLIHEEFVAQIKKLEETSMENGILDDVELEIFTRYLAMKDFKQACIHLDRAYQKNFSAADIEERGQLFVAYAYLHKLGLFCEPNEVNARKILIDSLSVVRDAFPRSFIQYHLGLFYEYGVGGEKDLEESMAFYNDAKQSVGTNMTPYRAFFLRTLELRLNDGAEVMMIAQQFIPRILPKLEEYRMLLEGNHIESEEEGVQRLRDLFADYKG